MNTAFETIIGIALLAFVIVPPAIGHLRERDIDRQLRTATEGRERGGVAPRHGQVSTASRQVSTASRVAETCRAGLIGPSTGPGLRH